MRSHGGRLIGPNCLGVASSAARLNATFGPPHIPAGNIGFSSQSGALGLAFLAEAAARGLGLSAFVSIGNKADVSSNDLLEHFEEDAGDRAGAASTSSRSATRAASAASRGAWRAASRSWP